MTHDAAIAPPGIKEPRDQGFFYRAMASLDAVKTVVDGLKPKRHIHGHYHHRYTSKIDDTIVEGLGANVNPLDQCCFIWNSEEADASNG